MGLFIKKSKCNTFIEKNLDKITSCGWNNLCSNPNALHIIEKNLDKITNYGWYLLCTNINAIYIIEKNLDKLNYIDWNNLCKNPNALDIIKNNINKIEEYNLWGILSMNSSIFEYPKKYIEERMNIIKEELIQVAMHPKRIFKRLIEYSSNEVEFDDIF